MEKKKNEREKSDQIVFGEAQRTYKYMIYLFIPYARTQLCWIIYIFLVQNYMNEIIIKKIICNVLQTMYVVCASVWDWVFL